MQEINSGKTVDVDRAAIQTELSVLGRFLLAQKEMDIASFKTPDPIKTWSPLRRAILRSMTLLRSYPR